MLNLEDHVILDNKKAIKDKPVMLKGLRGQLREAPVGQILNNNSIDEDYNFSP